MKLKAFTLAEVLITLTIIGIVAALSIPALNTRVDESKFIAQLNKANNTLQNSLKLATINNENLPIKHWSAVSSAANAQAKSMAFFNELKNNMSVKDNCTNIGNCLGTTYYTLAKKQVATWQTGINCAMTTDGETICMMPDFTNIVVDINGPQSPNIFGVDTFIFTLINNTNSIIIPKNDLATCNKDIATTLYTSSGGCTEWALQKGNMDYRRKTVSW